MPILTRIISLPRKLRFAFAVATMFGLHLVFPEGNWALLLIASCCAWMLPDLMANVGYMLLPANQKLGVAILHAGLNLEPENPALHLYLGHAYQQMEDPAGSLQYLDRAIYLKPTKIAYRERSIVHFLLYNFPATEQDLQAAMRIDAHDPITLTCQANLDFAKYRYREAFESLQSIRSNVEYKDYIAYKTMACHLNLYETNQAIKLWQKHKSKDKVLRATGDALIASTLGDFATVLTVAASIREDARLTQMLSYCRAIAFLRLGEIEMAYKTASQLMQRYPLFDHGLKAMLEIMLQGNDTAIITHLCDRLHALNPWTITVPRTRALMHLRSGNLDAAREQLTLATTINANSTATLCYQSKLALAEGDHAKAIDYARRATTNSPELYSPWCAMAEAQMAAEDYPGALESLAKAKESGRYISHVHALLARAQRGMGQEEMAKIAEQESDRLKTEYEAGLAAAMRDEPLVMLGTEDQEE